MNKLTKGALTMVLVGSITFSVTNTLLADHSSKPITPKNTLANSGHKKAADNPNQGEKTLKDQTPTTDVKDVQPTHTDNIAALQAVSKNENKSNQDTNVNEMNPTTIRTASTTANTTAAATNTTPATSLAPVTNTAPATSPVPKTNTVTAISTAAATSTTVNSNSTANGTTSTTSAAAATPTSTSPTTTSTTNHGQQVSQAAKEKAANRK